MKALLLALLSIGLFATSADAGGFGRFGRGAIVVNAPRAQVVVRRGRFRQPVVVNSFGRQQFFARQQVFVPRQRVVFRQPALFVPRQQVFIQRQQFFAPRQQVILQGGCVGGNCSAFFSY